MVDHNQRLAGAHVKAKEIISSGKLGKVLTFKTNFGHKGPEYWSSMKSKATWFFDNKQRSRLGVIGDLGIHKIDLLRYLLDDEIVEFKAFSAALDKTKEDGSLIEVPDNMVAAVKTKKGSIGTLSFSLTYYGDEDNSTTIYCQKGIIKIYNNPTYALIVEYPDGSKVNFEIEKIQTNDNQTSTGMIDEFVSSILKRTSANCKWV
jgi:predicted dehydrogenase